MAAIIWLFGAAIGLAVIAFYAFVGWKVYAKAGQPGWAVLVPFYNTFVLVQIAGREWWWFLLCFIPFVSIAIFFILFLDLAKKFGKSAGFGVGLFFLGFIFFPLLAFGDAQYEGGEAGAPPPISS